VVALLRPNPIDAPGFRSEESRLGPECELDGIEGRVAIVENLELAKDRHRILVER
jgi:hypothetical protein